MSTLCTHSACDMRAVAMLESTGRGLELVRVGGGSVKVQPAPGVLAFCRTHLMNSVAIALEVWSR